MNNLYLAISPFSSQVDVPNNVANIETATVEIVLMILGAFLLGLLFRHFIGFFRKKEIIIDKNISREEAALHLSSAANNSGNDLAKQIATLKMEVDKLAAMKICNCADEKAAKEVKLAIDTNTKKVEDTIAVKEEIKKVETKVIAQAPIIETKKAAPVKKEAKVTKKVEVKTVTPAKKAAKPEVVTPDDLKVIEGIGPALEKLLNTKGIFTYAQMAAEKTANLEKILDEAGPRFRVHVPETWPEQARLLKEGKMAEFKVLTEKLKGGRRV